MRRSRRIVALLLALIIVSALLPVSSLAVYKYQNLKFNQWYRLQKAELDDDYEYNLTIYKVKVTTDTLIMVNWKNQVKDSAYASIHSEKGCTDEELFWLIGNGDAGSRGIVLYPGTYYIRMYDDNNKTQVKFTKKSIASVNKPNYCLQKSITLKANKKAALVHTKKYNYDHWYKIKLPKNKKVTFFFNDLPGWYVFYDSNLNEIRCKENNSNNTITTYGVQSKGTYYIVLGISVSDVLDKGRYHEFYWN